jgi:peroxiredoxin
LLEDGGLVVVFVEPDCDSCERVVRKWQDLVDASSIPVRSIVGITNGTTEKSEQYRSRHRIAFPILRDFDHDFLERYQVNAFPYEVIVSASGIIRSAGENPVVDLPAILRDLSGR